VTFNSTTGPNRAGPIAAAPTTQVSATFLTHAFVWMFAGLLLTAAVATLVQGSPQLYAFARGGILPLILFQLGVVVVISAAIRRINATVALGLFFVYAASLGLTVGLIVSIYSGTSVAAAFLSASGMFGGAALFGAVTKRSLAGIGGMLSIGLIGLVVAMVVNLLLGSSTVGWIISVIGVVLFTAITAWDIQRIGQGQLVGVTGSVEKAAVIGALHLYLDFVNLFLFMLRLMGGRR
jgi:FtsH-binding integral membrane protein